MDNDFAPTLASAKLTNATSIDRTGAERNDTETCLLVWRMRTSVRISAHQQMYGTTVRWAGVWGMLVRVGISELDA